MSPTQWSATSLVALVCALTPSHRKIGSLLAILVLNIRENILRNGYSTDNVTGSHLARKVRQEDIKK